MTTQEAIKYIFEFLEASDLQAPASEVFKAGMAIGTIQKAIETKEQDYMLDKIRAEIAEIPKKYPMTMDYENGLKEALAIIDKYKE